MAGPPCTLSASEIALFRSSENALTYFPNFGKGVFCFFGLRRLENKGFRGDMKTSLKFLRIFFKSMGYLGPIWLFLITVIFGFGLVIAKIEGLKAGDGIYFAWVTAFTVGYGDIVPTSPLSRICSLAIALTGMIFTGLWVAVAVNSLKLLFGKSFFDKHHHK